MYFLQVDFLTLYTAYNGHIVYLNALGQNLPWIYFKYYLHCSAYFFT